MTHSRLAVLALVAVMVHALAPSTASAATDPSARDAFVRASYEDFLDRPPSATELTHWTAVLDAGGSRRELIGQLANSDEWLGVIIDGFYESTLGRPADVSGRSYWVSALRAGMTPAQAGAEFYASHEFFLRSGGSNVAWVTALYREILGRTSDESGRTFWASAAASDGRTSVAGPFYQSLESRRRRVHQLYAALLGRPAEPAGGDHWAQRLLDGRDVGLAIELASSQEYDRRARLRFPATTTAPEEPESSSVLFSDHFAVPTAAGLITNEYATWNPERADRIESPHWTITSGTLYWRNGAGWTGVPDDGRPDATSSVANGSAVFRMITREQSFDDVRVRLRLRNNGLHSTDRTPAVAWDGVHVFLRYQSEESLYYASANRRDDTVVIKKKVPGGPSNGGTYYTLGRGRYDVPTGAWQNVEASVRTLSDGSVRLRLWVGGVQLIDLVDDGSVGGAPIRSPGRVGVRGDNVDLEIEDFVVQVESAP